LISILNLSAKPPPPLCYCCVHLKIEALNENIGRWETTWFNFHILHLICFNLVGYSLYQPGGTSSPPGASTLQNPLFNSHRLAGHTLPPGATLCGDLSRCYYRLTVISRPPGAIPQAFCYWFWHSICSKVHCSKVHC